MNETELTPRLYPNLKLLVMILLVTYGAAAIHGYLSSPARGVDAAVEAQRAEQERFERELSNRMRQHRDAEPEIDG